MSKGRDGRRWQSAASEAYWRRRNGRIDRLAALLFGAGGLAIVAMLMLIIVYLVVQVVPLFQPPGMALQARFNQPGPEYGHSLHLAIDPAAGMALRITSQGALVIFSLADGSVLGVEQLPLPAQVTISSIAHTDRTGSLVALGLSDGGVLLLRYHRFSQWRAEAGRGGGPGSGAGASFTPATVLSYPLGEQPLRAFEQEPVEALGLAQAEEGYRLWAQSGSVVLVTQVATGSGQTSVADVQWQSLKNVPAVSRVLLASSARWIAVLDADRLLHIAQWPPGAGSDAGQSVAPQALSWSSPGAEVQDMVWLAGGESLLSVNREGILLLWQMVVDKGADRPRAIAVRQFTSNSQAPVRLVAEAQRRVFMSLGGEGSATLFHATAGRVLLKQALPDDDFGLRVFAPQGDYLLVESRARNGQEASLMLWQIDNPHPEVSWRSLWGKVRYESHPQAEFLWQTTAADLDYEAKYSLTPLVFGTLKAAFYALLLAAPLAIASALYTACFMAPSMRRRVKPALELMEALPTVVIGLLAALWLAPVIEANLLAVLIFPGLLVLATLLASYLASRWAGPRLRQWAPAWLVLLLIPLVVLTGYAAPAVSQWLAEVFFSGDFLAWLTVDKGVTFDQRNGLVVGIALGLAVIPTIFSLAEDAVSAVPRHLAMGAMALGARPWQVLLSVVLPTAAPGIFSAVMFGFGRAVGETMIVMMVTGGTGVMNWNMFEGLRSLPATLAVEAPESAVASTHFRVLFLGALVLFAFTFVVNTLADVVRDRLRRRYSAL